jgi:putative transposase
VLRTVGVHSSTYYARQNRARNASIGDTKDIEVQRAGRPVPGYSLTQTGKRVDDKQIKEWLMEFVAGEEHIYGYYLLAQCLRDQHHMIINPKKVYRLCAALDILQPQRRKIVHYPRKLARNHIITGPNQLWQLDIKYGYVAGRDLFFYIADMIDVFDRKIVGYYMGSTCEAKSICGMVAAALAARIKPGQAMPLFEPTTALNL